MNAVENSGEYEPRIPAQNYALSLKTGICNYKSSAGRSAVKGGMYRLLKIIFRPQQRLESSFYWRGYLSVALSWWAERSNHMYRPRWLPACSRLQETYGKHIFCFRPSEKHRKTEAPNKSQPYTALLNIWGNRAQGRVWGASRIFFPWNVVHQKHLTLLMETRGASTWEMLFYLLRNQ